MRDFFRDHIRRSVLYRNSSLTVYLVLRALVILIMVRSFLRHSYESVFLCILTLLLMLIPSFLERRLKVRLPETLEIIILLFIFAAEILGEINSFYIRVPHWDTILHTINGFLCAAIGFALIDLMNRSDTFSVKMSPFYLALTAFCFSMTIGVLWEFFEYSGDLIMHTDMQKDTIVHEIYSVEPDPTRSNSVVAFTDIQEVILVHSDGTEEVLGLGGYLDIGIHDIMKDLMVNFVGAVVFSFIGYFYIRHGWNDRFLSQFIPKRRESDPHERRPARGDSDPHEQQPDCRDSDPHERQPDRGSQFIR